MTWADIFAALEALLVLPALLAALVLAWKAAGRAETILRFDWTRTVDGALGPVLFEKAEAASSRHCN